MFNYIACNFTAGYFAASSLVLLSITSTITRIPISGMGRYIKSVTLKSASAAVSKLGKKERTTAVKTVRHKTLIST